MELGEGNMQPRHYVLVHGSCHGGWSWHKVKPMLESASHKVTAIDLAASGINTTKPLEHVNSISDYSQPLLELLSSLPPNEKVVLVGHSFGGFSLALAMDKFPHKVAVGVFLTAFMPDTEHKPSYVIDEYIRRTPADEWLDTQFCPNGDKMSMFFGPKFMSDKLYQLCPVEDLELGKSLIRPGSLFVEDLSAAKNFSRENYGSVPRVFMVCKEDKAIREEFQLWMIQNTGANKVLEIKESDHMPMLSTPQQLCSSLLDIAKEFA